MTTWPCWPKDPTWWCRPRPSSSRPWTTSSGICTPGAASSSKSPHRPCHWRRPGPTPLEFIRTHVTKARTVPLAGNSIGTDRRFLAAYLPEIEEYLHYRSIDVSTIKELANRWYPDVMKDAPVKTGGHRAMDDIRESVAELAYYRTAVFRESGTVPPRPVPPVNT